MEIGAGRIKKEDDIDKVVGIIICKKVADRVESGNVLAYIHANDEEKGRKAVEDLKRVYVISEEQIEKPQFILGIID